MEPQLRQNPLTRDKADCSPVRNLAREPPPSTENTGSNEVREIREPFRWDKLPKQSGTRSASTLEDSHPTRLEDAPGPDGIHLFCASHGKKVCAYNMTVRPVIRYAIGNMFLHDRYARGGTSTAACRGLDEKCPVSQLYASTTIGGWGLANLEETASERIIYAYCYLAGTKALSEHFRLLSGQARRRKRSLVTDFEGIMRRPECQGLDISRGTNIVPRLSYLWLKPGTINSKSVRNLSSLMYTGLPTRPHPAMGRGPNAGCRYCGLPETNEHVATGCNKFKAKITGSRDRVFQGDYPCVVRVAKSPDTENCLYVATLVSLKVVVCPLWAFIWRGLLSKGEVSSWGPRHEDKLLECVANHFLNPRIAYTGNIHALFRYHYYDELIPMNNDPLAHSRLLVVGNQWLDSILEQNKSPDGQCGCVCNIEGGVEPGRRQVCVQPAFGRNYSRQGLEKTKREVPQKSDRPNAVRRFWEPIIGRDFMTDFNNDYLQQWNTEVGSGTEKSSGFLSPMRPIACLISPFKLMTAMIAILPRARVLRLMPANLRALRKGEWKATHAHVIDTAVFLDQQSLHVEWIDYSKASTTRASTELDLRRGVPQRDTLSPLLFLLVGISKFIEACLTPSLFSRTAGVNEMRLNHQFYMDDLKLYIESVQNLHSTIGQMVLLYQAMRLEVSMRCALASFFAPAQPGQRTDILLTEKALRCQQRSAEVELYWDEEWLSEQNHMQATRCRPCRSLYMESYRGRDSSILANPHPTNGGIQNTELETSLCSITSAQFQCAAKVVPFVISCCGEVSKDASAYLRELGLTDKQVLTCMELTGRSIVLGTDRVIRNHLASVTGERVSRLEVKKKRNRVIPVEGAKNLAIAPLSFYIDSNLSPYEFSRSNGAEITPITHQFYMDDLKLYSHSSSSLERTIRGLVEVRFAKCPVSQLYASTTIGEWGLANLEETANYSPGKLEDESGR
ncbi:unnamed protein product [Caenorhabditis auriculariae]|uniref:Reverse transcriptase domain-containing protein n=1 Tax=Caenorhabditis auriculariae TaxID=2777116 RepID=A0A8S1HE15_9PELO|nr:unnamed protein product [Caenorhabditis auriculariae]